MATNPVHPDIKLWKDRIRDWYPSLNKQTFFLPPVHMNRTQYEDVLLPCGERALVSERIVAFRPQKTRTMSTSDIRDDQSQQKVLRCLHQLHEVHPQVMFVLSQLEFVNYLNDPCFAEAASTLPRPLDLKAQNEHRGEFDVLIVHRHYGILVVEMKAIGDKMSDLSPCQQSKKVADKVKQSIKQLQKEDRVLHHLLSDLPTQPRILKTLMLPNATRCQLQRVMDDNPAIRQDLCTCLNLAHDEDPIPFCFTSDDVTEIEGLDDVTCTGPGQWWQKRVLDSGPDPAMTDDLYLDLVSRFGGPATTVKVFCSSEPRLAGLHLSNIRTPGEGVEETGNRFTPVDIVLHPKQVDILNDDKLTLAYVTGPPGTGKTLVLQLKAIQWLREGLPVHVVSTWYESLAASEMLVFLLQQTMEAKDKNLVHRHHLEVDIPEDVEQIVETLGKAADDHAGQLFVIMDEACAYSKDTFNEFFAKLHHRVPNLHLWAAGQYHGVRPEKLTEVKLTQPLRTPPAVTEEVKKCQKMRKEDYVYQYTDPPAPLPADGMATKVLMHKGEGHEEGERVYDCLQCGRDIAVQLSRLNVGGTDRASTSPKSLQYRDVFLLTYYGNIHDTETDDSGKVTQEASGIIRGIREGGIPVKILTEDDAGALKEVAAMRGPNEVVAAQSTEVQGLERKIVVFAQADGPTSENEDRGRLQVMSRCTAQLIWVKPFYEPP